MTIEEQVTIFEHNAEHERKEGDLNNCLHFRQLAEWLKELKEHREAWMVVVSEVDQHTEIHSDGELYIKNFDVKKIIAEYKPKDGDTKLEQQPCDNAISSKDVRDTIWRECSCEALDIDFAKVLCLQRAIKALPPVTPQPKMGKWISNAEDDLKISEYTCSNCKGLSDEDSDFCPKCGCKMREETEVKKMQIDSKSPCGTCEKSSRCKTENKDKVRECGAYKPSEFFDMIGMSIEEKVDSFNRTIKFLNKIKAEEGDKE